MTTLALITQCCEQQDKFFATHRTLDIGCRRQALDALQQAILRYEPQLLQALQHDLGKSHYEGYVTELGLVLRELRLHRSHLRAWSRTSSIRTGLENFVGFSSLMPEPYGRVLIMAPWNYPMQLCLLPLIGAISAGNCAVIKPSEHAPATALVLEQMIKECLPPEYVAVITGALEVNQQLLAQRWDYIFFTGSTNVGRYVMEQAAHHLTPVTLELGGKSPCIVHCDANVPLAAKRIMAGKLINCGQTCVAPDYILVHTSVAQLLIEQLALVARAQYGHDASASPDYPRIVNQRHFDRLVGLMQHGQAVHGGQHDRATLFIAPTIITQVSDQHPIMQEEIFGPLLPILTYEHLSEAIQYVNSHPKPLALYFFGSSRNLQRQVLQHTSSGGVCINDTLMHVASHHLPFGGVGASGMGAYHGRHSFCTFSHYKPVLRKCTWIDIPLRYAPFAGKLKWARRLLR